MRDAIAFHIEEPRREGLPVPAPSVRQSLVDVPAQAARAVSPRRSDLPVPCRAERLLPAACSGRFGRRTCSSATAESFPEER